MDERTTAERASTAIEGLLNVRRVSDAAGAPSGGPVMFATRLVLAAYRASLAPSDVLHGEDGSVTVVFDDVRRRAEIWIPGGYRAAFITRFYCGFAMGGTDIDPDDPVALVRWFGPNPTADLLAAQDSATL